MIRTYLVTVDAVDDPDASPSDQLDAAMSLHRAVGATLSSSTYHTFRGRGVTSVSVRVAVPDVRRGGDRWVTSPGGWASGAGGSWQVAELEEVQR